MSPYLKLLAVNLTSIPSSVDPKNHLVTCTVVDASCFLDVTGIRIPARGPLFYTYLESKAAVTYSADRLNDHMRLNALMAQFLEGAMRKDDSGNARLATHQRYQLRETLEFFTTCHKLLASCDNHVRIGWVHGKDTILQAAL